jgi:recombination protein RecT
MENTKTTEIAKTQEPAKKVVLPIDKVRQDFTKLSAELSSCLPSNVSAEKFIRVTMTAIQGTPKLLDCDRKSLFSSALKCASDGLLPDGREAVLIAQKNNVVRYMPMVAGICKRARNSGEVLTIDAKVVYENDSYDSWTDEKGAHFTHRIARGERGNPILTYAYALTKDGGFFFDEITEADMAEIEKMATANNSPWKGPFRDEMRRKSAIRRLAKYRLPSSSDLDEVIRADDGIFEEAKEEAKIKATQSLSDINQRFKEIGLSASAENAVVDVPTKTEAPNIGKEAPNIIEDTEIDIPWPENKV